MEEAHDWYRALSAEDRSWVGMVAHAGIAAFIAWHADPETIPPIAADVFGSAPRELTRSITLNQTLDLIRSVVDVVEQAVPRIAAPGSEHTLREAVLTYSREVAFASAHVYAQAAEIRGAWDARLESLVVDAVLRAEADEALESRVSALGWGEVHDIVVVAGAAPPGSGTEAVDALRRSAIREGVEALTAVQGRRLIAILGSVDEPLRTVGALAHLFGDGPIVVGPRVPHLFAAGRSARAALSGLGAAPAWAEAPRPCLADELLAERALAGDHRARHQLLERVHRALEARAGAEETMAAYLRTRSIEATARTLFVHPNTVRYRLAKFADDSGFDLTDARDAFCVQLASAYAALPDRR
ncbi:PucR family transcriptional regulator [Calidifontibacter sp. DB0510]|uniref:PucR family transcriptional regulator n=2 Tax=Metallococcus carri TaxID=1656884 RepID=A0A967EBV3_9MICO|nr:PucR family transcriptional regulator [Metallococcus carri]NOP39142.1 helix-turn-helix domain-containing protein [Calidifontibacter sp. DB2511S]